MPRPPKPETVEKRIAELERERDTLAAQLATRETEQEAAERATHEAQALAVRDGSDNAQERARKAEAHVKELSLEVLRLQSAVHAAERDILAQHEALEAARAHERQQARDALKAERDKVLAQLDATPTNRDLWVAFQRLYDRDYALAREIYGERVTLGGTDGHATLWRAPGRVFSSWAASLEVHVFHGKGSRAPTLRELAE